MAILNEVIFTTTDNTTDTWYTNGTADDWWGTIPIYQVPFIQIPAEINKPKKEYEMKVYDVVVVDTKECEILLRETVIAEDEKAAMLELPVTDDIKQKQRKGQIRFIFNEVGGFNRYTRKVRIKEEDED